jgi:sarcosine oxidase subunit gamma
MPETLQRMSPLDGFRAAAAKVPKPAAVGVHLTERQFLGYLNLRGDPENSSFVEGVQQCLGVSLPVLPNTLSQSGSVTALWLSPDEWLLITQNSKDVELASRLRTALHDLHVAITDLPDGQTTLHLSGANALDVLRKGCHLDLHPSVFGFRNCAQTLVAKAPVVVWRGDDLSCFNLIIRRSFAEYLALWLQDAGSEYGFEMG